MTTKNLLLILGDQLSLANPVLESAQPGRDVVVLAEVAEEAGYVPHNRHKIALIFSAMRHFSEVIADRGFETIYYSLDQGMQSLEQALEAALATTSATA
ncbi:MAG: cryptochrome/photolyase family protein, partial [Halieaceae bacterium]